MSPQVFGFGIRMGRHAAPLELGKEGFSVTLKGYP